MGKLGKVYVITWRVSLLHFLWWLLTTIVSNQTILIQVWLSYDIISESFGNGVRTHVCIDQNRKQCLALFLFRQRCGIVCTVPRRPLPWQLDVQRQKYGGMATRRVCWNNSPSSNGAHERARLFLKVHNSGIPAYRSAWKCGSCFSLVAVIAYQLISITLILLFWGLHNMVINQVVTQSRNNHSS